MAFTRPVVGADISAADFGQPVYDLVYQPAWQSFGFAANFQNYAGFQTCQLRKVGTRIEVRGVAQRMNSVISAGQTVDMLTIPAGLQPASTILMVALCGFASPDIARIDILPGNKITVQPRIEIPVNVFVGFSGVYWVD